MTRSSSSRSTWTPSASITTHVETSVYVNRGSLELLIEEVLADFRFRTPYRDFDRSVRIIGRSRAQCERMHRRRDRAGRTARARPHAVFYQMTRAYLVGRICGRGWMPFVLALQNTESGVLVDAIMLDESTVSILFSFTRSYFHVDLAHVGEVGRVPEDDPAAQAGQRALHRARPRQAGQDRALPRALPPPAAHSTTSSCSRRASAGLVMVCFTLPSFDVVFKVIRDRFAAEERRCARTCWRSTSWSSSTTAPAGSSTRRSSSACKFPKARFSADLLEELLSEAAVPCASRATSSSSTTCTSSGA